MHLDKNQLKAVKANERNVLVVAAPGSGKTTVIINRIKYLVDEVLLFLVPSMGCFIKFF